ncbi:hypothetical protein CC2G_008978 [Coprinopsis cinerea AmutBmut pab1-1]|nr:hypothetical protein CC2G_008978 [Coprinopsis cinerea AmutBmut pab1-1]
MTSSRIRRGQATDPRESSSRKKTRGCTLTCEGSTVLAEFCSRSRFKQVDDKNMSMQSDLTGSTNGHVDSQDVKGEAKAQRRTSKRPYVMTGSISSPPGDGIW